MVRVVGVVNHVGERILEWSALRLHPHPASSRKSAHSGSEVDVDLNWRSGEVLTARMKEVCNTDPCPAYKAQGNKPRHCCRTQEQICAVSGLWLRYYHFRFTEDGAM